MQDNMQDNTKKSKLEILCKRYGKKGVSMIFERAKDDNFIDRLIALELLYSDSLLFADMYSTELKRLTP